jgi:hypothetical protein
LAAALGAEAAAGAVAAEAAAFGAVAAGGSGAAAATACAVGVGRPVAELVSLVAAVTAAAGFAGFGAGGSSRGTAVGAEDAPAPGASVLDTSPFKGSAGPSPAGLSAAAVGGVGGWIGSDGFGSSAID